MLAHYFFRKKYQFGFSKLKLYVLFLMVSVISFLTLLGLITFMTVQKGKTQAKAAVNVTQSRKYDPIAVSQQLMEDMPKSLVYEVSYDPQAQTAEVVDSYYVPNEINLPIQTEPEPDADFYSFKLKLKDKDGKYSRVTWLNYKKSNVNNNNRVNVSVIVPDNSDLQLELANRVGKNIINKRFSELPSPKHSGQNK